VLQLGAGQGRDTLYLARQGLQVTAMDIAPRTVETISVKAREVGLANMVSVARHDMREALPLVDDSIDVSYSHMLFCMALTTVELGRVLIDHLAVGFRLIDVTDFTEGELPRRLARVTMRVPQR